jgi:hypothetical protein
MTGQSEATPFVSAEEVHRRAEAALVAEGEERKNRWTEEARAIRDHMQSLELTDEQRKTVVARWAEKQIEKAKERGHLMTDRQYQDMVSGRFFKVGDRARYIGPDRPEQPKGHSREIVRKHGQLGKIINVLDDGQAGRIVKFRPLAPDASSEHFVELEVREFTPGFLVLERVAD